MWDKNREISPLEREREEGYGGKDLEKKIKLTRLYSAAVHSCRRTVRDDRLQTERLDDDSTRHCSCALTYS